MKARLTIFNGANRPEEAKRVLLAVPDLHSKRQDLRSRHDALRGVRNSLFVVCGLGEQQIPNESEPDRLHITDFLALELAWERRECDASRTKPREKVATDNKRSLQPPDLVLSDGDGKDVRFSDHEEFLNAALHQIESLKSTDSLYAFWSRNSAAFGKLKIDSEHGDRLAKKLVDALKERARQSAAPTSTPRQRRPSFCQRSDDGTYLIPKEKRFRDRAHLAFVASEPCLVCGRRPAQAHHLRFAQSRAMALKVSDEFTVPLCNTHHDELHRSGDERAWWAETGS